VTEEEEETARVVTVNVAVELPAATATDVGTVAAEVLLLDNDTLIPPVGATPDKVIVPVDVVPPVVEIGLTLTELSTGGVTVRIPV
jgi:hypothetical protein